MLRVIAEFAADAALVHGVYGAAFRGFHIRGIGGSRFALHGRLGLRLGNVHAVLDNNGQQIQVPRLDARLWDGALTASGQWTLADSRWALRAQLRDAELGALREALAPPAPGTAPSTGSRGSARALGCSAFFGPALRACQAPCAITPISTTPPSTASASVRSPVMRLLPG